MRISGSFSFSFATVSRKTGSRKRISLLRLPGKQNEQRRLRAQAVAHAELRDLRRIGGDLALERRVTDEARIEAVALEKRRLERQERQQMIDEVFERAGRATAPRRPKLAGATYLTIGIAGARRFRRRAMRCVKSGLSISTTRSGRCATA